MMIYFIHNLLWWFTRNLEAWHSE